MNKRYVILILLCLWGFVNVMPQIVRGVVLDENADRLPYITVRMLGRDSTFIQGIHTDSLGTYLFEKNQYGDYLLYFSSVGYKSKVIPIQVSDKQRSDTVLLASDNVMLKELVVKGGSFVRVEDK